MANLVVAFPDKRINRAVCSMLESGGFRVMRSCMTGNEVMRAFTQFQDGILVCATRFPDRTADELACDLDRRAMILVCGRPDQLELCEHADIFKLKLPADRGELTASVNLLAQLFEKQKPRRSPAQDATVREAKALVMAACGVDEDAAHRALQRYSMRRGLRLTEVSKALLDGSIAPETITSDGGAGSPAEATPSRFA